MLLGLLPLVYGSFVLAYGLVRSVAGTASRRWAALGRRQVLSALLFALPTLAWILLLRTQGTAYYNHEAVRYHQLVWLPEAWARPWPEFEGEVLTKLRGYAASLQVMGWWLLLGAGLLAATWWRQRLTAALPQAVGPALA